MRFTIHRLTIEFVDGEVEHVDVVTPGESNNPGVVEDGVLHVYSKNGQLADREHVGSWPLTNIRKYRFEER